MIWGGPHPAWTAEHTEILKVCWAKGFSSGIIARDHLPYTRNAILGKAHRLKLPRYRPITSGVGATMRGIKGSKKKIHNAPKKMFHTQDVDKSPSATPPLEDFNRNIPIGQRRSLLDLGRGCHWPVGTPKTDAFFFCGGTRVGGSSYCATHDHYSRAGSAVQPQSSFYKMAKPRSIGTVMGGNRVPAKITLAGTA